MALGFGFNKAKILSAAEKYVQQGKLQNAILEYDKICKQDPKDLTVLNTIGDLYARLGRADQAAEYFKRVGEAYASNGFVVKAIAMYKKLTKLHPAATDSVVRLAELYTQQGLYNDARAQYMAVADQCLKENDREKATGILKKMLELDPENAGMQTKVADLYLKLGRNKEALDIFYNAAQSLYGRGSAGPAEEALGRVFKLDPNYPAALLLGGKIAAESGNTARAIQCLSKLPDLDSRPDALQPLLQAYLKAGNFEQADPLAAKLLDLHGDFAGLSACAEALMKAGKFESALAVYEKHADKFLSGNSQALVESLTASISKVKDSTPALQAMLSLFQKARAGNVIREVQELLAHAYVQSDELQKAADLYRELSEAEPENPLHQQNYRQLIARMGKDSATRELSTEEGGQALMVDELETALAIVQEYPRELADAINAALTDSELFSSYNVPGKAIPPLERVLPKAPNDVRLRQRLASLYARVDRFADAANACTVLADVHAVAGFTEQATQYRDMAAKYSEQAAGAAASAPDLELVPDEPPPAAGAPSELMVAAEQPIPFQASSAAEFAIEAPPISPVPVELPEEPPIVAEFDLSAPMAEPVTEQAPTPKPEAAAVPSQTDGGTEWEEMLTVETPTIAATEAVIAPVVSAAAIPETIALENADELAEEAGFYVSQGMDQEARSAITRLEAAAPGHPALMELRASLAAAASAAPKLAVEAPPVVASVAAEPVVSEPIESEFEIAAAAELAVQETEPDIAAASATVEAPDTSILEPEPEIVLEVDEEQPLEDIALDLSPAIGVGEPASFTAPTLPAPVPAANASVPISAPVQAAASFDPLADLVSDVELALGDLEIAKPAAAAASVGTAVSSPQSAQTIQSASPVPAQVANIPATLPGEVVRRSETPISDVNSSEAQSMLTDLLDELKEDAEEPLEESDPDTHYNLGVAFREMGLLDEAIGELQKVCHAIESGKPFSQVMQAYTWLAQCLVDKGAPQAAIRWYERALRVSGIGEDSRLAVHYDMAAAFEAAGNHKAALDNFMEVYGSNIDYRDVAERIRGLRQ